MRILIPALAVLALSACTGAESLAPGLTARMDAPGAKLDRAQALNIVNQFRATKGTAPLVADSGLESAAQTLAAQYATSGTRPQKPGSADAIRVSAGYANFAETFSGWRSTETDASALLDPAHKQAGIGVAYSPTSTYGVYWVMLLSGGAQQEAQ